jgi:plastocyanin
MHTARFAVPLLVLALIAIACGGGDRPSGAADGLTSADDTTEPVPDDSSAGEGSGAVTIVAQDISFDITEVSATVGESLDITFDNRDSGLQHSLHVRDTAVGDQKTEIAAGPVTQALSVTFDQAGDHQYFCDVHPFMTGTITVE